MADGTRIEWTDATWNIVNGCSVTSPGCTNCYAMRLAGTRLKHVASREGLTAMSKAGPVWTGETRFNEPVLLDPLRWKRPRRIFVCAHGDLFHESVPDAWIDRVFAVMALAPQHQFQVLTKRAERMREYCLADRGELRAAITVNSLRRGLDDPRPVPWPLPNVWLGVSVEDQKRADERIPHLLATPAAVRWLSCEPLLGPVDLEPWLAWPDGAPEVNDRYWGCVGCDALCTSCPKDKAHYHVEEGPKGADGCPEWITHERVTLDWIVAGGESGPGARPMHPDWARSLRDQCAAAGVPFLFKQWGEWLSIKDRDKHGFNGWTMIDHLEQRDGCFRVGKKAAGRLLDGVQHDGFPA